ncbi:MAG: hypothetical protein NTX82_03340 [Candidatus Parcubacteria bacterium]|nr:hypothetical protein [Candidatus Parcubacteria bacterium]
MKHNYRIIGKFVFYGMIVFVLVSNRYWPQFLDDSWSIFLCLMGFMAMIMANVLNDQINDQRQKKIWQEQEAKRQAYIRSLYGR